MRNRTKAVKEAFGPICGLPCWRVCYDPGLNLCMSFGNPNLNVEEPPADAGRRIVAVSGEWWLWLNARWKFSMNGERVATSSSSLRKRLLAVRDLDGQKLVEARVRGKTGSTKLTFDLGGVLEVRRSSPKDTSALWLLYEPDGSVLAVRGDGTFSHESPPAGAADPPASGSPSPLVRRPLQALVRRNRSNLCVPLRHSPRSGR